MSFRAGLFLGSAAALLAGVPAALRVASAGSSALGAWVLLAGGTALYAAPLVALSREALPLGRGAQAFLLSGALGALPLAAFGRLLQQNTHHRPLGAATFAVLAVVLLLGLSLVGYRVLARVDASKPRVALGLLASIGLFAAVLVARGAEVGAFRSHLLDGALVVTLLIAALALPLSTPAAKKLAMLGPPLWAVLALSGVALSRGAMGDAVGALAPVLAPLNGW